MSTATITIEGWTSKDAELKFTPSGQPVLEITVPVTPQRKGDDGRWVDIEGAMTAWYRCSVWGRMAEALTIAKGTQVQISGVLKPREWEKDGQTRVGLDVTVKTIGILREPKNSDGYQRPTTAQTQAAGNSWQSNPEEPPF